MHSWVFHELVVLTKARKNDIHPHEMLELENKPGPVRSDELSKQHTGNSRRTFPGSLCGVEQGMSPPDWSQRAPPCPILALSTKPPLCTIRHLHKWFSFQIRSTGSVNVTLFQKQGGTFRSYQALKVNNSLKNKPTYACLAPHGSGRHFCFPLLTSFRTLSRETGCGLFFF